MSLLSFNAESETLTVKEPTGGAELSIRRYVSDGVRFYDLKATLKTRSVSNDAVSFCSMPDFLASLDVFERSRSGEAILNGTDDCRLVVRPNSLRGDAWIEFRVTQYLLLPCSPGKGDLYGHYSLSGGIAVLGEDVAALRDVFSRLFSEYAPTNE
jgi:hypothetical protein